jgi:hypothetical protein
MGDDDLVIKSWDANSAICALPRTGADAAGLVKVVVNKGAQFSNKAPLTSWHGTASYTLEEAGSLTMTMTFNFVFRGDIHGPREGPGEAGTERSVAFGNALVSSGTYAFSGGFDDAATRFSIEWAGSGTLTARSSVSAGESYVTATGSITHRAWQMVVTALASLGNHVHTTQRNAQGTVIDDEHFDQDGFGVENFGTGSPFFGDVGASFDIAGGSRELLVASTIATGLQAKLSVTWSAFPAAFAPDSTTVE